MRVAHEANTLRAGSQAAEALASKASTLGSCVTLPIVSLNRRLVLLVGEVNLLLGRLCLLFRCCRRWRRRRRLGLHGLRHLLLGIFHGLRAQKSPVRPTFQCCSFAMHAPQVFSQFMLPNRGSAVLAGADRSSVAYTLQWVAHARARAHTQTHHAHTAIGRTWRRLGTEYSRQVRSGAVEAEVRTTTQPA